MYCLRERAGTEEGAALRIGMMVAMLVVIIVPNPKPQNPNLDREFKTQNSSLLDRQPDGTRPDHQGGFGVLGPRSFVI